MERFWAVMDDGGLAVSIFYSAERAEAEARDLAFRRKSSVVYVLEAVTAFRKTDVERIDMRNTGRGQTDD